MAETNSDLKPEGLPNAVKIDDSFNQDWQKVWTTEYSLFSLWLFAEEYSYFCKKEIGFNYKNAILIRQDNLVTCFRLDLEIKEFNKKALEKILDPKVFKIYKNRVISIDSSLKDFTNLKPEEFLQDVLKDFISLHNQYLPYFLVFHWTPDIIKNATGLDERTKEKIFKECLEIKKLTKNTFPQIENYLNKVFSHIESQNKMSQFLARNILPEELINFVTNGELPSDDVLIYRRQLVAVTLIHEKIQLLKFDEANYLLDKNKYISTNSKNINGTTAYPGIVIGRVKKILWVAKEYDFEPGSVLVTTTTRPEHVIIMKQASAIVTDTGSFLCHAAIVSRELKIPCIIDTKNATQVLNDGDLVEFDGNNGVVKVLKKSKLRWLRV